MQKGGPLRPPKIVLFDKQLDKKEMGMTQVRCADCGAEVDGEHVSPFTNDNGETLLVCRTGKDCANQRRLVQLYKQNRTLAHQRFAVPQHP